MSKEIAKSILRGARQALAIAKGEADPRTYRVHIPHEIDVRRIRTKLGLTQAQFAARFGFSVDTLRHWEQGRRMPDGPARAYLKVIDHAPKAVAKALKAA
jgi:putative transcriptional regulator